jgi:hypothetical protein
LNRVEQVSTNSTQTSYGTTATDIFKLINGIRRHIENDHCRCCKVALINTFSVQNIGAGSTGDQATEPAADDASFNQKKVDLHGKEGHT